MYEPRFTCECGLKGDYWDYQAAITGKTREEAHSDILAAMGISSLKEIRYPWDGQDWFERRAVRMRPECAWVAPPRMDIEGKSLRLWTHPSSPGDVAPSMAGRTKEFAATRRTHALEFAQARRRLQAAARECRDSIKNAGLNTVARYYRLGEIFFRLRSIRQREGGKGSDGVRWGKYLERFAESHGSPRDIRRCIELYEAVEFVWQLEPYPNMNTALDAIQKARRPTMVLGPEEAVATPCEVKVAQNFNGKVPTQEVTVAFSGFDPGEEHPLPNVPTHAMKDRAARTCELLPGFARECLSRPQFATSVGPLLEAVRHLFRSDRLDTELLLNLLTFGVQGLACTDKVPDWLANLQRHQEEAEHETPELARSAPKPDVTVDDDKSCEAA